MSDNWTRIQEKIARAEGWCLSERDDGLYQIQKLDDVGVFETDDAALDYVRMRARQGGFVHQRALRLDGTRV